MEGPPAERLLTACEIFSRELGRQRPGPGWDRGGVGSSVLGGGMGIPQVVNSMTYKYSEGLDDPVVEPSLPSATGTYSVRGHRKQP